MKAPLKRWTSVLITPVVWGLFLFLFLLGLLMILTSCTVIQLPEPEVYQDTKCKVFVQVNDSTWKCEVIK